MMVTAVETRMAASCHIQNLYPGRAITHDYFRAVRDASHSNTGTETVPAAG